MSRYREPFLEPKSRKPIWRWPNEIPIAGEPADVAAAVSDYNAKLQKSELPKLLLHATPGAVITAPLVDWCRKNLKRLKVVNVGEGTHYLQEDHPHEIGSAIAGLYRTLWWGDLRCAFQPVITAEGNLNGHTPEKQDSSGDRREQRNRPRHCDSPGSGWRPSGGPWP